MAWRTLRRAFTWTRWQEDQALGAVVTIGIAGALVMALVLAAVTRLALAWMLAEPRARAFRPAAYG